jgi:cysteine desulfurase
MIWSMFKTPEEKKRIYLDFAAATPLSKAAFSAMEPFLTTEYGNASAIHAEGRIAKEAVAESRRLLARTLGVRPEEVFFVGTGTEANNLAVLGYLTKLHESGREYVDMEVVMTKIEHPSLQRLDSILMKLGVKIRYVDVDEVGSIDMASLRSILTKETVLVTFAYANSEIGTIQPVGRVTRAIREFARHEEMHIQVHLDAAQAPLWLSCQIARLGVDSLALDAGKCYGPKGVGVLFVKRPEVLSPLYAGGGQEKGLRGGTENVAGIVGAATALVEAQKTYEAHALAVAAVRDEAISYLNQKLPQAIINGPQGELRLPNNLNFSLPGCDTEYAVVWLDTAGIAASTKSACAGAGGGKSHVVLACTKDEVRAGSTIRLSLGLETTTSEVMMAIDTLAAYVEKMKGLTH